jgi:hypothetical protein
MPGRNGMGPWGQGPMTGRRMGRCGGAGSRANMPRGPGLGPAHGGGRGEAWRHRIRHHAAGLEGGQRDEVGWPWPGVGFPPALPREQELAALKRYVASLEETLNKLKARIQQIEEPAPKAGKEPR